MIRRETSGEFLLITQHDHALLSGRLARRFGNARFAPPDPRHPTIQATALHDCGWPAHDENPTLNSRGRPLHVFETTPRIAVRVWTASAEQVMNEGDYTALLVSLHVLSLSTLATTRNLDRHDAFAIHKFQHAEIERQAMLRRRLGLPTDRPLQLGLAPLGVNEDEDRLRFNFGLLQAMDRISLALCCSEHLFDWIDGLSGRPGDDPTRIQLQWSDDGSLTLEPWPFDHLELSDEIPFRRLPGRAFADEAEFRALFADASTERLPMKIRAGAAEQL